MTKRVVQCIINNIALETEVDNIATILGAAIEQLTLVTNPETAAEICGKAQNALLDRGTIR